MADQHNRQSRFREAFRESNEAVKSNFLRLGVNATVRVAGLFFALKITGAYTIVDQFIDAHGGLMLKAFAVYCLLYPFLYVVGMSIRMFLEGLFGNQENQQPAKA